MTFPIPPAHTGTEVDLVHQLLRHLDQPAHLEESAWASSCLVKDKLSQQPQLRRAAALQAVLADVLTQLTQEAPLLADLLRGHFWEGLTVAEMLANNRPEPQAETRFYKQQRQALERFTSILLEEEARCTQSQDSSPLLQKLPLSSYRRLFGVDSYLDRLRQFLADRQRHPILSIKGIGGIGKTALADAAVRAAIRADHRLRDVVWVSAKQEYLSDGGTLQSSGQTSIRLEQVFDEIGYKLGVHEVLRLPLDQKVEKLVRVLRADPYLIVLDNLESVADFHQVMPWLVKLASPTQFLLTARETLPSFNAMTQVEVGELDHDAGLALLHFVAEEKGVPDLDPEAIFAVVGGNPLALILAVSQMQFMPSQQVLEGLRTGSIAELYTYIFWKSWSLLEQDAREILFGILRAGDAVDWDWLTTTTEYSLARIYKALQQLLDLSLVQPQQDGEGRRLYTIHRLTSTFLRAEVLGWK